jgi:twitching motility protein PilU
VNIDNLLKLMLSRRASDAFITAGAQPSLKVNGVVQSVAEQKVGAEEAYLTVTGLMSPEQHKVFDRDHECNFAIVREGVGRFRISAFYQRSLCGMVVRRIETAIPKIEHLGLPPIIKDLAMTKRGLVIFVGAAGTGKSTSLAAMIGHRNQTSTGHIICIEDPIEFVHEHAGCIITQREVGIDTDSYEVGLKNTLRQAPDVIMIGEVRSQETMEHAIAFAETGHLCLCTLHANNANQALDRILHFFPQERHDRVQMDLSLNLRAMVAQQLIPTRDGKTRRAVTEVLLNTPLAAEYIRRGEVNLLKELMTKSIELGMHTFDQSLFNLYKTGEIDVEEALHHADSRNDLRLMIKLDAPLGQAPELKLDDEDHSNQMFKGR